MRIEVSAKMYGEFILKESIIVKSYPYDFMIFYEKGSYYISISKKVIDYELYITKCQDCNGIPQFTLTISEIYEDMIEWLQYIESMGAFNFGVKKIDWEEPKITWIPECDAEYGIMPLLSHQQKKESQDRFKLLKESNLQNIVIYRRILKEIYIPFTYFRQGRVFFDKQNYYFAFINFFMMLEYCFANGKFKKEAVLKEMYKAGLLRKSVNSVLEMVHKEKSRRHFNWIKDECKKFQKEYSVEGILYLLIEYRGILSHAGGRSKKYIFNNQDLFSLAFLANMICFVACGNMQIYMFLSDRQKENYIKYVEYKIK